MQTTDCGIIILAAGSSSRLGKAKQLLRYKNKTFLQHSIDEALAVNTNQVVVVTGANKNEIISQIQTSAVQVIHNNNWQEGMASSIQSGLSALLSANKKLMSAIVMLCDQPFVSTSLLNDIIQKKQTSGKGIVACVYKETLGVPALFDAKYFEQLFSLKSADGAKKIIMTNADDVATIPFPLGAVDIDTAQDYEQFIKDLS